MKENGILKVLNIPPRRLNRPGRRDQGFITINQYTNEYRKQNNYY